MLFYAFFTIWGKKRLLHRPINCLTLAIFGVRNLPHLDGKMDRYSLFTTTGPLVL